MKTFIAAAILLALTACAPLDEKEHGHHHDDQETHFEPHYAESLFKVTENRIFSIEMVLKEGSLSVGANSLDVIIHGQGNKDVEGAQVRVVPWMPEHRHGISEELVVKERGAGLYSLSSVPLTMEGLWELDVIVSDGGKSDHAVFSFPDVKLLRKAGHSGMHRSHMGHEGHAKPDQQRDLSKSRATARKQFMVAYQPDIPSIPLNRIHSWKLKVEDMEGKPVSGVKIQIDGDMPEHGHGLPTRPQATREIEPGLYLIEGMKFTMPGWWAVTFYLDSSGETDYVIVNLDLR